MNPSRLVADHAGKTSFSTLFALFISPVRAARLFDNGRGTLGSRPSQEPRHGDAEPDKSGRSPPRPLQTWPAHSHCMPRTAGSHLHFNLIPQHD